MTTFVPLLETATQALVKLSKDFATAKHAAQLAEDKNDLPWSRAKHRPSSKRCGSIA